MQYAVGIPPEMRSNFDYIFLLAEDTINNRKKLFAFLHCVGEYPCVDENLEMNQIDYLLSNLR